MPSSYDPVMKIFHCFENPSVRQYDIVCRNMSRYANELCCIFQEKRRSRGLESGSDTEYEKLRKPGVRIQDPEPVVQIQEQPSVFVEQKEALVLSSTAEQDENAPAENAAAEEGDVQHEVRLEQ